MAQQCGEVKSSSSSSSSKDAGLLAACLSRQLLSCLDLTSLTGTESKSDIVRLCADARDCAVAAVCVYPQFVGLAASELRNTDVKVATVINFPSGREGLKHCVDATASSLRDGADEVDVVIDYELLLQSPAKGIQDITLLVSALSSQCADANRTSSYRSSSTNDIRNEQQVAANSSSNSTSSSSSSGSGSGSSSSSSSSGSSSGSSGSSGSSTTTTTTTKRAPATLKVILETGELLKKKATGGEGETRGDSGRPEKASQRCDEDEKAGLRCAQKTRENANEKDEEEEEEEEGSRLLTLACEAALRGGADFLKTSTGKASVNASPLAVKLMAQSIRRHSAANSANRSASAVPLAGLKVAGGVKTLNQAVQYLYIAQKYGGIIADKRYFRIGASSLLAELWSTWQRYDELQQR